jgi:hypothetical protein
MAILGIVLIVGGILALIYQGITYRDKDSTDLGPVEITTEHEETLPIPPIIGGIAIVGGIVLLATAGRKT